MKKAIIIILSLFGFAYAQTTEELMRSLKKEDLPDTQRIYTYIKLAGIYIHTNLDSNMKYSRKAMETVDTTKKDRYYAGANMSLSKSYFLRGDYSKSVEHLQKGLKVWVDQKFPDMEAEARLNWANNLTMLGDFTGAIEQGLKAMKYFEEHDKFYMSGDANNLLGAVFYYKGDYDNAAIHYEKAIEFFNKAGKPEASNNPLNNLGIISVEKKDFKKAKQYFDLSLEVCKKTGNILGEVQVYNNLGYLYQTSGDWELAMKYLEKVLEIAQKGDNKDDVLVAMFNLGEAYRAKGDYVKALDYLQQSRDLSQKVGKRQVYVESFRNKGAIFYSMKKYLEASDEFIRYIGLKDSLLNEENSNQINELKTKYETEKKEKDLELANAENEKVTLENKRQSIILIAGTVVGILIFVLLIFSVRAYRTKQKDNLLLNEQKRVIEKQKDLVEEKQKEIVDSINYALQIQKTLLANHDFVNQTIPDSFVMFRPKDIVSGDFYWATRKGDLFYLALCDSTGHGVPGAFMSLLNISFLNEAVNEKNILSPEKVFDHVRDRLTTSISQSGRKDGMDGILLCFDQKNNKVTYAAANNSPVLVSKNELLQLEADKMPVGVGERKEPFRLFEINIKKGDVLFLYTDGYADQFGGEKGKKFKYRPLNELLLRNASLPVEQQKQKLEETFAAWKGDQEQVDDVAIIGIRY